jgi:hypothetical protein
MSDTNSRTATKRAEANYTAPSTIHRVEADGVRVFYRAAGDTTAPVVLLLHGFPASSFMFRELIPRLATDYRVIAPDLPGFGFTEVPAERKYVYSFDGLALTIEAFTQALKINRYAIYVFDYGAPRGLRLAVAPPSRIGRRVGADHWPHAVLDAGTAGVSETPSHSWPRLFGWRSSGGSVRSCPDDCASSAFSPEGGKLRAVRLLVSYRQCCLLQHPEREHRPASAMDTSQLSLYLHLCRWTSVGQSSTARLVHRAVQQRLQSCCALVSRAVRMGYTCVSRTKRRTIRNSLKSRASI